MPDKQNLIFEEVFMLHLLLISMFASLLFAGCASQVAQRDPANKESDQKTKDYSQEMNGLFNGDARY
jgi:outer membrane biogenesis lipoprotein LolB